MANSGLRDLGAIVPSARLAESVAAPVAAALAPASQTAAEPEAAAPPEPVFAADLPGGTDALGLDAPLRLLAGLAAHKRSETPLAIGLFGPSGSGKSFALTKLLQSIEDLSRAAATLDTPYTSGIVTFRVEAADISGNPSTALAGALHCALARTNPAFAAETARAARDPHAAAREALEQLDTARRKHEAEKRVLDEISGRRTRLAEAILYETDGSQVDSYARANRPRIRGLLTRLGIAGDPLLAFKDMAGAIASRDGAARRAGFALRAFFSFRGQIKLLAAATLLYLCGAGLGLAVDQQTAWLAWLRATESTVSIGNWLETHMDLLLDLREIIFIGAALALGVNVWRGTQLLRLVFRGADLLEADLAVRRRETYELFAFQARRVEALAAEVNILSRRAAEAEMRAGGENAGRFTLDEPPPFAMDTAIQQARTFTAAVSATILKPGPAGPGKSHGAPGRIVLALDQLDAVPESRAREILVSARALFKQGFVVLIAADSTRFAVAAGEGGPDLDKWVQVPFQLGELASRADYANLVGQILGGQILGGQETPEYPSRDVTELALDEPVSAAEARLLAGLAPLAGSSARALKRFVNVYRLARAQDPHDKGALAFMLALETGGTPAEIAAVYDALSRAAPEADLDLHSCGTRLKQALAGVQSAQGGVSASAARRAGAAARLFSFQTHGLSGEAAAAP